jgi:hypothetical protein
LILSYLGLAEKVVCEGREQGTGNREQGTGNSFNCLDILNFPNPTKKNALILRHH